MKVKKECRVQITRKIYKKLKYVVNKYGDTFYSSVHNDYITLLEPNTSQTIEIVSPKFKTIIGNHRKITLTLEAKKVSMIKYSYIMTVLLYC